ncbi:MAG: hypothetical protein IJ583_00905, partial [Firmicutes bacterium]|nr:hypothetical protein [Bacillota bacterium]
YYNIMLMQNMRYGIMNFDVLDIKKTIEKIKITDYEKAAEKYILKNQQCCYGILKASNKEKEEADFSEYERNDGKLKEYEEKKDGKRELESIPIINIREDIDENKIFSVKNITEIKNGVEIIYNEIKESDIVYINILADTSVLPFEMKRYLDIYRYVLAKIDSKNYGYIDLSNEIAAKTGDLEIYFNIYDDEKNIFPFMITSVKALNENIEDAVMLAEEVLYSSIFDDRERIRNLAKELLSKKEDGMIASGNIFALMRSRAYFDKAGAYKEMICGRESIKAIKECIEDTDKVCRIFEEIKKLLFVGENVKINISGKMKDCIKTAERFTKIYEGGKCGKDRYFYYVLGNLREKIKIDADVNFNALSADIKDYGYKYDGRMRVLEKIIESDHLWNTVRVKGGAYGGKISVERNGIIQMSSYRDPNYEKTYGYFKATAKYLENFRPNEREFSKFIIGTINNMDRPIKNNRVGDIALYRKFSGIDDEYMKMERKEILECKVEDIRNMSDIFVKIAESDYRCSLSGK